MPGDRDQYLAAGMDDFLGKPFTKSGPSAVLGRLDRGEARPFGIEKGGIDGRLGEPSLTLDEAPAFR